MTRDGRASNVTLKDISQKMNISMPSVHRAIYGKEGVGEELRKKVLETAKEMGYEPNYAASSMKRKAIRIAVVLPSAQGVGSLYYAYFWKGYRDALKEIRALNVETDEYEVEDENDQIELLKEIVDENKNSYSAVLTFSYTRSPEVILQYQRLSAQKIVVMVLDDLIEGINGLYCIPSSDTIIGEMCAEVFSLMLPKEGTILISSGRIGSLVHEKTVEGFKKYLKEHDSQLKIKQLPNSEDMEKTYRGFCEGLQAYDDVVGTFSLIARENKPMVRALEDTGMLGKVKVMGADLNMESAEFLRSEKIDALVYKNPYDKGFQGFQVLVDYVVKRIEPPKNIKCIISMVFKTGLSFYEDVIKL